MSIIKKSNKKNKKSSVSSIVICVVFFAILIILPVVTIILPKKDFSEMENIYLQSMPKFSAKTLFNGTYTDDLETYISHHFAGRVSWISMKSGFEGLLGKKEQNFMKSAYNRYHLSPRRYHKLLKLARTAADLQESRDIEVFHLASALGYTRFFDGEGVNKYE